MSLNLITTIEHVYAKAAQDVVAAAKFILHTVVPVLKKAAASEKTVEDITGLIDPQAVNVERAAFAVLGHVIKAIESTEAAVSAGGVNIQLDAALIADIKSIIPTVKAQASSTLPNPAS